MTTCPTAPIFSAELRLGPAGLCLVRISSTLCISFVDFALAEARPCLSQSPPLLLNIFQQTNSEKRREELHRTVTQAANL